MRRLQRGSWAVALSVIAYLGLWPIAPAISAGATLGLSSATIQNSANQKLQVTIDGTDQLLGADLYVQIGDGGPENGGTTSAPAITGIKMSDPSMVFAGNANQESYTPLNSVIALDSINSPTPVSDAHSILATITLDASSLQPGSTFTIRLANVAASVQGGPYNSDVVDSQGSATSIPLSGTGYGSPATLTVVAAPEPGSFLLLVVGAVGVLSLRRVR